MDAMQALLPPGEAPSDIFYALYLNRLPEYICDHLATRSFDDMCVLAQYADKLWDDPDHRHCRSHRYHHLSTASWSTALP